MRNRSCIALAALVAVVTLSAGPASSQAMGSPYVIGVTVPLTGPQANYGNVIVVAAQLGADDVNRRGGVRGHPLKVVAEDTGGAPQGGIAAMRKLVEIDGAHAILTAFTNTVSAQIPLADQLKIPTLSGVEAQGAIPSTAVYSFAHSVRLIYVAPFFRSYWKSSGKKRIFAIFSNNAQGQGMSPPIREAAAGAGAEYQEAFLNPTDTDFRGILARVKDFNPDAVMLPGWADNNEVSLIRQIRELGITAQLEEPSNNYSSGTWRAAALPYLDGMVLGGVNVNTTGA
ncbi:MAG: ABC transporter substrate-binding protein, partial [Candidatus Eremiobacteraeota bacterium]|nr:ABC transporter substrate-binding protein [Candidatus Eremiobacteraeota bacterium]